MKPVWKFVLPLVLTASGVDSLVAQPVISAKSGVIAYVEGKVLLGDQPVEYSVTKFPELKEQSVLRTEEGRAEVLLTPGVILRLGENSSLKLMTNRLIDTRLELQSGSAVVEADAIAKDNHVTVVCRNGAASLDKAGVYRFNAAPGVVKVFKGRASVAMAGGATPVSAGRLVRVDGASAAVQKFNDEETDALDRWSRRRGEYLAVANVSAAKSLMDRGGYPAYAPLLGIGYGGYAGLNNCSNAWAFNQWYGMYTYMPCQGVLYSPYGYAFWSPYSVMGAYYGGWYPGGRRGFQNGIGGGGGAPPATSGLTGYRGARDNPSVMSSRGANAPGGFSGGGIGARGGIGSAGGSGASPAGGAIGGSPGGGVGGGAHGGAAGGHGGR